MTEATTPGDGAVSAAAAARLAALRAPSKKKGRPADASKILAAGLSTTFMLGLVTAMGWPSGSTAIQIAPAPAPTIPAPALPAPTSTVVPLVPTTAPPAAVEAAPAAPVTIPVAIPATAVPVAPDAVPVPSNSTTSASG